MKLILRTRPKGVIQIDSLVDQADWRAYKFTTHNQLWLTRMTNLTTEEDTQMSLRSA